MKITLTSPSKRKQEKTFFLNLKFSRLALLLLLATCKQ